ncbi:type II toxin-antitoxin system HicA family toxin [Nocardiopsis oceani]
MPSIRGGQLVKVLERSGFQVARVRGSHYVLRHPDGRGTTIPVHQGRDLAKGTLRSILKDCGISVEELQGLL